MWSLQPFLSFANYDIDEGLSPIVPVLKKLRGRTEVPVRRHQQNLVIGISVSNLERTLMNGDDANTGDDNAKESDGNANKGDGEDDASERPFYNGYNLLPYSQLQTVMLVQVKVHF